MDECSPPKAKRRMLSSSSGPQSSAGRVNARGHREGMTSNRSFGRSGSQSQHSGRRRRSLSQPETQLDRKLVNSGNAGSMDKRPLNNTQSGRSQNAGRGGKNSDRVFNSSSNQKSVRGESVKSRQALASSSLDCEDDNDDESPEIILKESKFSKINDTITKCKKFSHLHVKPTMDKVTEEKEENLDNTFTIDPSDNLIPLSVIPHVDDVPCTCVTASTSLSVINSESLSNKCTASCAKVLSRSCSYTENLCMAGVSNSQDQDSLLVEPAMNYSNCVDESQTGLPKNNIENDSGTSTIVDQSANSVTSLASLSTLVDGQENLSQNLSEVEENSLNKTKIVITEDRREFSSSQIEKLQGSLTVTKSKPTETDSKSLTVTKGSNVDTGQPVLKKAMRSIKFDDLDNTSYLRKGL